jgi:hypothetical protein
VVRGLEEDAAGQGLAMVLATEATEDGVQLPPPSPACPTPFLQWGRPGG